MKLSIALATFNGEAYLRQQLDSFRYQICLPDELVISDDGSTDSTLDIAREFQSESAFPVRIIAGQTNLGYAGNFNRALLATTGDLVFMSDQDDYWFPHKLERMVNFASQRPEAYVLMCDAELTDEALNVLGITKLGQIKAGGFADTSFVMGCCGAVRREFLDTVLPIPGGFPAHDNWLMELADGVGRKQILKESLQYYRRHETNQSNYIANSTMAIRRRDVLKDHIQRLISGQPEVRAEIKRSIYILEELASGASRAASKCSASRANEFYALSCRLDYKAELLRRRMRIRSAPYVRRLGLAFALWMQGGYRTFSGYKSMMRDIAFR